MKLLPFAALFVLCAAGVYLVSVAVHEAVHIATGKGGWSVCMDYNMEINSSLQQGYVTAHVVHDPGEWANISEFRSWQAWSEKWAAITGQIAMVILGMFAGVMIAKVIK